MSPNSTAPFTSHLLHSSLYINLSLQPHCLISTVIILGCVCSSFFCYNNYSALEIVGYPIFEVELSTTVQKLHNGSKRFRTNNTKMGERMKELFLTKSFKMHVLNNCRTWLQMVEENPTSICLTE